MLRIAAALAKQASSLSPAALLQAEHCARALVSAPSCLLLPSGARSFSDLKPDPEANPQPSQRVLEIVEAIENLSVKDLVWLNSCLKDALGISDADLAMGSGGGGQAAAAPAAAAAAAEPVAEKTEFTIFVESYDASAKIKIIKEVRAQNADLGLKQAKELVRIGHNAPLHARCVHQC